MQHLEEFKKNQQLIDKYGEGNAHLIWTMGLYLDESDLTKLAVDGLTDGAGDKKIDFIFQSDAKLYIVQGYYSVRGGLKIEAPSNKASDLNTALAWIFVGDESKVPDKLREKIIEVRKLLESGDIEEVELLYIHNCSESPNVKKELETCANYLKSHYENQDIDISYKELGCTSLEKLYTALPQQIVIRENIDFTGNIIESMNGDGWTSHVGHVSGIWLYNLFHQYGSDLFSANYRGFMGIGKRKKINTAIRQTAENSPNDFFVFNNGISVLTTSLDVRTKILEGISIINGAQTTGSISTAQDRKALEELKVMCRIIVCNDSEKVRKIVQYNNTQNHITTWDHYTNSPEQRTIVEEFKKFGYAYSLKRGFDNNGALFGIESVAQPLVAFHGDYLSANRGKNYVFETKSVYDNAFHESKAQHILLAYCISKAIEKVKSELKTKSNNLIQQETKQLTFLQNLKSKYFLTAVIGKIIDELSGKPVEAKTAKFCYNTALVSNNTLENLIDLWCPVIKSTLPTVIQHTGNDLYSYLTNADTPLEKISGEVKNTISTIRSLNPLEALDVLATHLE